MKLSRVGTIAVCVAFVCCAAVGFTLGGRYERATHDEWHRAADCPADTWRYSWCVPIGCAVDLATIPPSWDCGSRAYQEFRP
jgi:hypothetical protein